MFLVNCVSKGGVYIHVLGEIESRAILCRVEGGVVGIPGLELKTYLFMVVGL